ncbi:MAG: isoleucine--tRNA ligase [Tannerellaceae bacterium]|jgi:isoleucyl-tRNA synthetase|nr:isoleucine--tRNA ligase [Tannerellaceae bacterium]
MSNKKFAEYTTFNLSAVNREVLRKWEEDNIFRKSIKIREGSPAFVFYEGPPSANGMPGIHHVVARAIKDIFCRYKTMKGFAVNRKAGWDTHGLPVELGVEKELCITKEDIGRKISIADYNAACRKAVMKYTREWEDLTRKIGFWVDMDEPYVTCDNRYIETLWHLLSKLYQKGLLYKGYTIQPYSPAAGTGLSTHELNQPGAYRDVKDTTCTAQFRILTPKPAMTNHGEAFFLAWTTTPWTLPSNTALCVGPSIRYVAVETWNAYTGVPITVVLARDLVPSYFDRSAEVTAEAFAELPPFKLGEKRIPYRIAGEWSGEELTGIRYEQLIPWVDPGEGAFRVIPGDFVTTADGTGIVHIAPTFGADDAKVARINGAPPLLLTDKDGNQRPMVDLAGKFFLLKDLDPDFVQEQMNVADYDPFAGRYVKNEYDPQIADGGETLDISICLMLKVQNRAFRIEKHIHNYPHCWRTDKPVLYYPLDSWFIRTTACRERMIELNETITWKPASTGTGRFGKWLENLQDWNLSRSRFWGTPLPIWRTEDGSEEICIGSLAELIAEIEKSIKAGLMEENPYRNFRPGLYTKENYDKADLHRPYVDDIILVSSKGKPMKRELDLIDVWFDSGAMPYAQIHYPFENREAFESGSIFPADFIAEGVDQTRGWFFTLHAIAAMTFDSVSFRAVVSNGLVLDRNGNKMSKRLNNAVDPFETIEQNGSDPLRWYMITNASPWDNVKFDPDGLEEVKRKFFGTLYNTYSFFALYANVDNFDGSQPEGSCADRPEIDRWILSLLNSLTRNVDSCFDNYEPTRAGRAISDFVVNHLSNWYVRLNRRRFWGGEMNADKISAYQTLYACLETVARLMAPIAPFYSDRLFTDLVSVTGRNSAESVHLADFPVCNESLIDAELEERMQLAQEISSMTLALRRKVNIKVRRPLQALMIPVADAGVQEKIEAVKNLILNEVNVKEMIFVDGSAATLVKKVKPDFKKLGPRYGKIMKPLAEAIKNMSRDDIATLETAGRFTFNIQGQEAEIVANDVEIISEDIPGWLVANEGRITVALDITISEALRREGIARDLVNRIQNLRKSNGLEITDKIKIHILSSDETDAAVAEHKDYIMNQALAVSLKPVDILSEPTILEFDDFNVSIRIDKV